MKVILDCNIIISAGLTDGACRQVVLKALKQYQIVVTDAILLEYRSVAQRKKFSKVKDLMLEMINLIESSSILIDDTRIEDLDLPDRDDLIYLYASINADAKYLITGNLRDFPNQNCAGIKVVSPKEFLLIA